jgi:large subunit ribosomal protein L29
MKSQEIRAMSDEALGEELLKLRREQFDMRLHAATGQGTRPHQFGKIRKDIARIKTILHERVDVEVSGQSE